MTFLRGSSTFTVYHLFGTREHYLTLTQFTFFYSYSGELYDSILVGSVNLENKSQFARFVVVSRQKPISLNTA